MSGSKTTLSNILIKKFRKKINFISVDGDVIDLFNDLNHTLKHRLIQIKNKKNN